MAAHRLHDAVDHIETVLVAAVLEKPVAVPVALVALVAPDVLGKPVAVLVQAAVALVAVLQIGLQDTVVVVLGRHTDQSQTGLEVTAVVVVLEHLASFLAERVSNSLFLQIWQEIFFKFVWNRPWRERKKNFTNNK